MKKTTSKISPKKPVKSADVPATKAMLYEARFEMKHEFNATRIELKSDFRKLNTKIDTVEQKLSARIDTLDQNLSAKIEHGLSAMDVKVEKILSAVHRIELVVEEQNARNLYVLDGYTSLNDRLEKVEKAVGK